MLIFFKEKKGFVAVLFTLFFLIGIFFLGSFFLFFLFATLLLLVLFYPFFVEWIHKKYYIPDNSDGIFFVRTPDDWHLAVREYLPSTIRYKEPVLLIHGLMANYRSFDVDKEHSLALYLKERGYAVYAYSWRLAGGSFHPYQKDFDFDDLLRDIPVVIEHILNRQRRFFPQVKSLYWVGHSLGAIQAYLYLGSQYPDPRVKRVVSLAGPPHIHLITHPFLQDLLRYQRIFFRLDMKFLALLALLSLYKPSLFTTRIDDFLYNPENFHLLTLKRFLVYGVENVSSELLKQLAYWKSTGKITTASRLEKYDRWYENYKTPTLFLTGLEDNFCRPFSLDYIRERLPKKLLGKKRFYFLFLGKKFGFQLNYCHGSILFGKYAREEVYPIVYEFLRTGKISR